MALCLGELVPKESSPIHTHYDHQSSFTCFLHSIFLAQFTCLTVFLYNLCPHPLWSTSWSGTLHFILYKFLHPIIVFFSLQHMPIQLCSAVVPRLSSNLSLSLSSLLGTLIQILASTAACASPSTLNMSPK